MKVENLERAIRISDELTRLENAIKTLVENEPRGLIISSNSDHSGFTIHKQYKNGGCHPMYTEIYEFIHQKFIEAKNDLMNEIAEL